MRVPRCALPGSCFTERIRTVLETQSNGAPTANSRAQTWATAALTNQLAWSIFTCWRQTLAKRPRNDKDTHLICGELPRQLLLLLPGGHAIDMAGEQSNAITKLGTSPSATLPSGNRSSKMLKSLAPFAKLGRDLQWSASNTQGGKDTHTKTIAPQLLAPGTLPVARPDNAHKGGF